MHNKRRGVALLIVIMVAALVLVAVVGVSAYVSSEQTIVVSDNGFKASLSVAETGMTETVMNFRLATWNGTSFQWASDIVPYLTSDMLIRLATAGQNTVVTGSSHVLPGDSTSLFQVKLKKMSTDFWNGAPGWTKTIHIGVYSLGEKYVNSARNANDVVGRRIVYSEFDVTYNLTLGQAPTMESPFGYALLSGGEIDLSGNAKIYGSSIRSNDVVDVGSHRHSDLFVGDTGVPAYKYTVQTTDGINSNGQGGNDSSKWVSTPSGDFAFGNIYTPYYVNMFNDFKNGSGFYSGAQDPLHTAIVYPNTSDPYVKNLLRGSFPGSSATMLQIATFCDNVLNLQNAYSLTAPGITPLAIAALQDLKQNLERVTYYVLGPDSSSGGTMRGTIVVDGNLTLTGNADLSAGEGGIALLVHGNITKGTGNVRVVGSIYADGQLTQAGGSLVVSGSVATKLAMDKIGGSIDVHWVKTLIDPQIVVGPTPADLGTISVTPFTGVSGKWSEIDFDTFKKLV